jgi:hypothetical protein
MTLLRTALVLAASLTLSCCQTAPEAKSPHRASVALSQPLLLPIRYRGEECYQVARPWKWEWKGQIETVPQGLVVDGASVPRFAWWFLPPDGLHRAGALAHDRAYGLKGHLKNGQILTRAESDEMFHCMMLKAGVNPFTAKVAYRAVRLFGQSPWDSNEPEVILPVDQPALAQPVRRKPFFLRHIYAP